MNVNGNRNHLDLGFKLLSAQAVCQKQCGKYIRLEYEEQKIRDCIPNDLAIAFKHIYQQLIRIPAKHTPSLHATYF